MRKRTSDYSSDTDQRVEGEEDDVNLLRCPTRSVFSGFKEAKNTYERGNDEIRRLLMRECNLIYECNVCRNMFRNLNNFINHKQSYCRKTCSGSHSESGDNGRFLEKQSFDVGKNLKNNSFQHNKSTGSSFMNGNSTVNTLAYEANRDHFKKSKSDDSLGIKTEVDQLISKMETVLTSSVADDAAPKSAFNFANALNAELNQDVDQMNSNKMGNEEFPIEKPQKVHNHKKHQSSNHIFQCPACPLTFLQPAAVIRHLNQDHKKNPRRIRMMRESIVKRRMPSGEGGQIKQTSGNRELKSLQSSENGSLSGDGDSNEVKKVMSKCTYCDKAFERRAALSTHLMSCRSKMEALEKLQMPPEKRVKMSQATVNNVDVVPEQISTASSSVLMQALSGGIKEEMPDSNSLNEMFENLDKQTFGDGLKTVSLDALDLDEGDNANEADEENANDVSEVTTGTPETPQSIRNDKSAIKSAEAKSNQLKCRCKICNKQFNALSNLRRHISMFHYRARKFGCTLCEYRAFRRYDIVNHLGFVHKMTEDREMMSKEYVSVHEVLYSKDDMDGDIVLVTDEQEMHTFSEQKSVRSYEKRVRRKKLPPTHAVSMDGVATEGGGEGKMTRQKLKRSASYVEIGSGTGTGNGKLQQRRPIRNRIKTENKDFVYDFNNLLKEEIAMNVIGEDETGLRQLKRRNTLYTINMNNPEIVPPKPLISGTCKNAIKGAAYRMTLQLVQEGRAASATSPELPAERPQMRPRLTSTCRVDMQAVQVIETSDLEAARLKSTLLEDSFLEKISKNSAAGAGAFKIKPCLELQHSALDTLLQKVDSSYQQYQNGNGSGNGNIGNDVCDVVGVGVGVGVGKELKLKMINTPSTPIDAICQMSMSAMSAMSASVAEVANAITCASKLMNCSPEATIPVPTSPPATPRKRVTLMQRLTENKPFKHRDSLLRSVLEN